MTCSKCIPTPYSIYEDEEIDVFEQIIPSSDRYSQQKRDALHNAYWLRGIGSLDTAYWIQAMQLRYGQIKTAYDVKFQAIDEWLTSIASKIDLSDSSAESTQETSYGHVVTSQIGQRQRTDVIAQRKNTVENEDTPDTAASQTKFLSERNTTIDDAHTDSYTDAASSDSDTESGKDTVTFNSRSFSGLSSETVGKFIDSVRSVEEEFANEFKKQFYHGA